MNKVTEQTGSPWSIEAIDKLRKLWAEDVSAEMISLTLGRSEAMVRAKAAELGLPQHVESK